MTRAAPRLSRRALLRHGVITLPALAYAGRALAHTTSTAQTALIADPKRVLDLPAGFSYRILSRAGERMSDGYRTPARPDGMGIFRGKPGELVLMRNHEIFPGDRAGGPYEPGQPPAPEAYDADAFGGVTRVVIDERTLAVRSDNLVLTGTHWNCSGGLSPWGWLSCEEIFAPRHGYAFLCRTDATRVQPPRPIKSFGRFRHEAAATVPRTHITFLTEDATDAAFYRFVPSDPARPFEGKLQALAIEGAPRFDTGRMALHDELPIRWVDVKEPDPAEDTVRLQAQAQGAAIFRRNEGLWLHGDDLFLCATAGGPIDRGQVFRVRHASEHDARISLIAHTEDPEVLDMPDNLTVSPDGHLYAVEDGLDGNFVRRIGIDGTITTFAHNVLSSSELAGPCFAPDGKTMFVNIQNDGLTLAISGPFAAHAAADASASTPPSAAVDGDWPAGFAGLAGGLAVIGFAALARRKRRAKPA